MITTPEKINVIDVESLPIQIGKEIVIKGESIALFRLSNGEVYAIESTCPYTNGPLAEGIVSGEYVFCPLRDWKISLRTGEVQKPDDGIVKTYETEIIDGFVYIMV
ncbi:MULTISPECIES: nitrite reductase small subunit NirD [unclassified Bacillus (in: firmicutes)]|uniref:nitrite reductase small subunit NirD n=1 Tax=unclassified Bacillus (in: firmicutes) TaxID=185979 RepID=UPI000BF09A74|nr:MULTISPECIES: nitrite reductase small subunit NirD [unclassified Bacillus (in: firmicutes)]PEJ59015.1 nitrite reductase (NAD(P)H) small subunit [Bacillus sp. AFS002410]PEK99001.1 nitrite reductase (NAD(P)H) small subunit [Bacillus sp. AFS017336]